MDQTGPASHRSAPLAAPPSCRRWRGRRARLAGGLLGAAILVAGCGGGRSQSASTTTSAPPRPTTVASTTTCPLTGQRAPGGKVPQRPALAVKVDNAAAARPQYGLDATDVVYEQPVEGGITRFIAIYQCHDAERIEPVRSGRLIDPELLSQFGEHPLFAYSGGIDATLAAIAGSSLIDVGANQVPNAYTRDPNRSAPHNLSTSTHALFAAGAARGASNKPPAPVFQYGRLPTHRPAKSVHIGFTGSNVTWTWESGAEHWSRSYSDTGPATLGGGGQVATSNVVVMKVVLFPSQYVEDPTGAHQNLLRLTGSGEAQVFRNGAVINGRWQRPKLADKTEFVNGSGQTIPLTPGPTWIELVPTTVDVTVKH